MLGVRIPLHKARKATRSPAHHHGHVPKAGAENGVHCSEGPILERKGTSKIKERWEEMGLTGWV